MLSDTILLPHAPPHNIEAEQSVLGACLVDSAALEVAAEALAPRDFYAERHQRIFEAITAIRPRAVDLLTVRDELERQAWLETTGGFGYLAELAAGVFTTAHVAEYVGSVRRKARSRRAMDACVDALRRLPNADDDDLEHIGGLLALAVDDTPDAGFDDVRLLGDVAVERVAALRALKPGTTLGTTWGFRSLDYATPGLEKGALYIVAARPGVGKTAIVLDVVRRNAKATGKPWLFGTWEMSEEALADRQITAIGHIDSSAYRRLQVDWAAAERAARELQQIAVYVTADCVTVKDLRQRARWLRTRHNGLGGVAVDYLQLVDGVRAKGQSRAEEVAGLSRSLKMLARELECPVIAVSQLNREVEKKGDKRPGLEHLRESGAIEADAEAVLLLFRDDYYAEMEGRESDRTGTIEVIIAKQRNMPVTTVTLNYLRHWQTFADMERQRESAGPQPGRRPYDA